MKWPWQRELRLSGSAGDARRSLWRIGAARSSYAADEIRAIARLLPGRTELYLGPDAQKWLVQQQVRRVPLLHFSTHAIADTRDPDRSRILLAPAASGGPADYLFLREIYDLDLAGVQLVTLSACDTGLGEVIRGEAVEGFSRALHAAGAASATMTMWDVPDGRSAVFMKQFYLPSPKDSETSALQRKLTFPALTGRVVASAHWAGRADNDGRQRLPPSCRGCLGRQAVRRHVCRRGRRVSRRQAASAPRRLRPATWGVTVHRLITERPITFRLAPTKSHARVRQAAAPRVEDLRVRAAAGIRVQHAR